MAEDQSYPEAVVALAEEFVERYREGRRPPLSEYIARCPEHAEAIRKLFPAMAMMEGLAWSDEAGPGDPSSAAGWPAIPAPTRLGDYRILREIGRGGMGVVYQAEQVSLGRPVALKVLPGHATLDATRWARFEREARAAARLHHTNIVPVFAVGEHDGTRFYAMQYIAGLGLDAVLVEIKRLRDEAAPAPAPDGPPSTRTAPGGRESLSVAIAHSLVAGRSSSDAIASGSVAGSPGADPGDLEAGGGPEADRTIADRPEGRSGLAPGTSLSGSSGGGTVYWRSVARIGLQAADALAYAHHQRILHRDVKPSNLLLDGLGSVWLTDFGLAKDEDQQDLTGTGDVLGTLRYMAPEAFEGRTDVRSDVYSLGLTLFEMIALRPAFDAPSRNLLIQQVMNEAPPRLRSLAPTVPRDLETVVRKAIDREPDRRYQSAAQFRDDLERFLDDRPVLARRASSTDQFRRWTRRHKAQAASLAVIATLLVSGLIASLIGMGHYRAKEQEALLEADKSREVVRLLQEMIGAANPESGQGGDYTLREMLVQFQHGFGGQLEGQPRVEASLRYTLGLAYLRLGNYKASTKNLDRAMSLIKRLDGADHPDYAEALVAYSQLVAQADIDTYRFLFERPVADRREWQEQLASEALDILDRNPGDTRLRISALHTLQQALLDQGELARSEEVARKAIDLVSDREADVPEIALVLMALANSRCLQGDPAGGEALARRALRLQRARSASENSPTGWALVTLARCLHDRGELDEALRTALDALAIFRKFYYDGHEANKAAIAEIRRIDPDWGGAATRELFPNPHPLMQFEVMIDFLANDRGWTEKAIEFFLLYSSYPNTAPDFIVDRSWSIAEDIALTDVPSAIRVLEIAADRLIAAEGEVPDAYHNCRRLANSDLRLQPLYLGQGRVDDADRVRRRCERVIERLVTTLRDESLKNGVLESYHSWRISMAIRQRDFEAALRWADAASSDLTSSMPDRSKAQLLLTIPRSDLRNPALAVEHARRAVDREPEVAANHATLGRCLEAVGDPQAALSAFEEAARLAPEDASLLNNLARNLVRNVDASPDQISRAVEAARRAVSLRPSDRAAWNTHGVALYRSGSFEEAIDALRSSVERNRGELDAFDGFFLAMAQHRLGDEQAARDSYSRSIAWMDAHAPGDPELIAFRAEADAMLRPPLNGAVAFPSDPFARSVSVP